MFLFVLCVLCLTVLVNCLLNTFAICVGEMNVFSLKVMVLVLVLCCVFFCWLVIVLSSKEYVCCVCNPSVCLGVPSICQICVICCVLWSSLHVDCIFPFWDVVFVCVDNYVCEDGVCSAYVWWWLNVSELCPVCFPIVRKCVSVFVVVFYLERVLIVVIMGR